MDLMPGSNPLDDLLASLGAPSPNMAAPVGGGGRIPAPPMTPPPAMPATAAPAPPAKVGIDWGSLINMVGPVLGAMAQGHPAGQAAFVQGWHDMERQSQQDKRAAALDKLRAGEMGGKYALDVADHLSQFTDPVEYEHYKDFAKKLAVSAGLDGSAIDALQFPESKKADARLRELDHALAQLEGGPHPYNLDELAQTGGVVQLKDGTQIPISTALDLTRRRPMVGGKPVAAPEKPASTEEERAVALWAKDHGKKPSELTFTEDMQARNEYRKAVEKPPNVSAGGVDAQFNDLLDIWKETHPGQTPTASVRTQLRTQANRVNDKPRELGGMDSLYNQSDPKAIGDAIMRGDREPETASLGRPIGAAVDSYLATKGYNKAQAVTDWKATQRHIATMNGSQQLRLNQSINALPEMLDSVDALAAKWNGGRFAILNSANLALAKNGVYGPEAASIANQLTSQIADVTADLGNVYMGGNSPTDHALSLAGQSLKGEWDAKVLKDMVALARKNVTIRKNSIANTGVAGASAGNPYEPDRTPQGPARVYYDDNGNKVAAPVRR